MLADTADMRSLRKFPVEVERRLTGLDGSEIHRRPPPKVPSRWSKGPPDQRGALTSGPKGS
jgi:hypothetical protein